MRGGASNISCSPFLQFSIFNGLEREEGREMGTGREERGRGREERGREKENERERERERMYVNKKNLRLCHVASAVIELNEVYLFSPPFLAVFNLNRLIVS